MQRHAALLPIAATLLGVAFLSLMDAFMKGASLALGAYTASLLRSTIATAVIAPVWLARRTHWPERPVMRLHIQRGVVSAFMALTFFYALSKLPIAETIAISFIAPLVALYLARVLLGETIHPRAILASVMGFAGTLVIVGGRIGRETLDRDAALGLAAILCSAMLYAYNFILIRRQSQLAGPVEVATFHSGVSMAIHALAAPFLFVWPSVETLGGITIASLLTIGGAMALAWAYAREETQVLVPLEYSGFLWAALFGWLFFAEKVSLTTLAGTVLIVAGCLLVTRPRKTEQTAL